MTFSEQLSADIALIEPALEKYLSRETHEGYDRIFEAAKYAAMAGGKKMPQFMYQNDRPKHEQ